MSFPNSSKESLSRSGKFPLTICFPEQDIININDKQSIQELKRDIVKLQDQKKKLLEIKEKKVDGKNIQQLIREIEKKEEYYQSIINTLKNCYLIFNKFNLIKKSKNLNNNRKFDQFFSLNRELK